MKIVKLLSVILLLLSAYGCTKEDRDDCMIADNTTLMFVMKDQNGADRFAQSVKTVDLVLFNEEGIMYSHDRISESSLRQFPGIKKTIPPGRYYAVCWGNVAENSQMSSLNAGITTWNDCFIEIPSTATRTGDSIYYAPYKTNPYSRSAGMSEQRYTGDYTLWEVTVPNGGKVVKEMNFIRAHRTVNVYVKGLVDRVGNVDYLPTIEARQVWSKYNFFFETQTNRVNFSQPSVLTTPQDGETVTVTKFHGGFGEVLSDIDIIVKKGSDGTSLHTLNFRQFLLSHPEEDKNDVNILISFLDDYGVEVSVPDWNVGNITPGQE